jgi:hypothetical protein
MRLAAYCAHRPGYLKFADFVKFLEMNPFVQSIELSNSGEIFLNPDLQKIIVYAHQKDVELTACIGVNFNTVSDEMLETLVKEQFREITISIDGASQEIYSKYRRKGNFDTVIRNIEKLNEYKKKYDSEFPRLNWQYILMETNDFADEITQAQQMAKTLGMTIFFRQAWGNYVSKNLPKLQQEGYDTTWNQSHHSACLQLWNEPQINWDGRFFGCCINYWKAFEVDNVFETGLEKCLNSESVKNSEEMLMGGGKFNNSPCCTCDFYKEMVRNNKFIELNEINEYK